MLRYIVYIFNLDIGGIMSQKSIVLNHLKTHGKLSNIHAITDLKILRLAAIVHELRQDGLNIVTETHKPSNVATYQLVA